MNRKTGRQEEKTNDLLVFPSSCEFFRANRYTTDIRWGTGIDAASDLIDYAVMLGVMDKSGAHLSFGGEHLGGGRERVRETLVAKPATDEAPPDDLPC